MPLRRALVAVARSHPGHTQEPTMTRNKVNASAIVLLLLIATRAGTQERCTAAIALPQPHAHNDYHHARPLFDALAHGVCSLEADVFLVDGELLSGHSRSELQLKRTRSFICIPCARSGRERRTCEMAPVCRTLQLLRFSVWHCCLVIQNTGSSSLLFLVLPAGDARNFAAEGTTKINGSFVNRELVNGCPKL